MNKNLVRYIVFAGALLLMAGCDNTYDYHFQVNNTSSARIEVNIYDQAGGKTPMRKEIVHKGESKTILILNGGLCGNKCKAPSISENDFPILVPRIVIMQHDTLKAAKQSQNIYNWIFKSQEELGIYTMYISNHDFKP